MRDMHGIRYGNLVAIRATERRSCSRNKIWLLRCDCGGDAEYDGYDVRRGKRTSCKACSAERVRLSSVTHGKTETSEYSTWTDIQTRCNNPKSTSYPNYGGRGIRVCIRWSRSFAAFLQDMGPRPEGMSIERENNDGDYEPSNCHWASRLEQSNNRRTNVNLTVNGVTKTAKEWAEDIGLKPATLYRRIRCGWSKDRLFNPARKVSL